MEEMDWRGCLLGSHPRRQACAAGAPTPGPAQGCCEDPHPPPPPRYHFTTGCCCLPGGLWRLCAAASERALSCPPQAPVASLWAIQDQQSKTNRPPASFRAPGRRLMGPHCPTPCLPPAAAPPRGLRGPPPALLWRGLGAWGGWDCGTGCHPWCGDLGGVGEAGAVAKWRQTTRQCPSLAGLWGLGLAGGAEGGGSVWPGHGVCPHLPPHHARAQRSERPAVILCRGPLTVAQPFRG